MSTFLSKEDVATLTGAKHKSKQIVQLRAQGIPFTLTCDGRPIVARSNVEGGNRQTEKAPAKRWQPTVLRVA
jgi:Domain of unknown function (DUF4224)